jgi:hypothetical protein
MVFKSHLKADVQKINVEVSNRPSGLALNWWTPRMGA